MRIMYDSVKPQLIPTDAQMVAGYVNGTYAWTAEDWTRFPNARVVTIDTRGTLPYSHVLDVEAGDATPLQAVAWVQAARALGVRDSTIYCNISAQQSIVDVFAHTGVPMPHFWLAHYTGIAEVAAGAVATQFRSLASYDLSVVADYWPGVDPLPNTPLWNTQGDHMFLPASPTTTSAAVALPGVACRLVVVPGFNPDGTVSPLFLEGIHLSAGYSPDLGTLHTASGDPAGRMLKPELFRGFNGDSLCARFVYSSQVPVSVLVCEA
jgi:hypothetical protein